VIDIAYSIQKQRHMTLKLRIFFHVRVVNFEQNPSMIHQMKKEQTNPQILFQLKAQ
jgi:hypothetical protein